MNEIKLKPCPFCGGEAVLKTGDVGLKRGDRDKAYHICASVWVECKECRFSMDAYTEYVVLDDSKMELKGSFFEGRTVKYVIKKWNRRPGDEQREADNN